MISTWVYKFVVQEEFEAVGKEVKNRSIVVSIEVLHRGISQLARCFYVFVHGQSLRYSYHLRMNCLPEEGRQTTTLI